MVIPKKFQEHDARMQASDEHVDANVPSDADRDAVTPDLSLPGDAPDVQHPSTGQDGAMDGRRFNDDLLSYRVFTEDETFFRQKSSAKGQWAVVWSDLMMTMFILFVVLFAYQAAHREFLSKEELRVGPGIGHDTLPVEDETPKIYDLRSLVETEEAQTLRDFASVELAPDRTVRIVLASDFLFDLGQAEIKSKVREKLVRIAEFIRRTPNRVNVIGHTDNIPMHSNRFATNWELSVSRATAVARFLIEDMKLPGNRFYVSGYAEYQPLVQNTTLSNQAANRRVEIVITKEVPQAVPGTVKDIL